MTETANVNCCIVLAEKVSYLIIKSNFISFLWCHGLEFLHSFLFIRNGEFDLRLNCT